MVGASRLSVKCYFVKKEQDVRKKCIKMATDKPPQMNVISRGIFARFLTCTACLVSKTQINLIKLVLGRITFPSS